MELIREETIGDKFTDEQEKLLAKRAEDGFTAFHGGKIAEADVLPLAMLWKRGPLPFFKLAPLKGIDPALRGPAA